MKKTGTIDSNYLNNEVHLDLFRSPRLQTSLSTVKHGITYDVTISGFLNVTSISLETVFSCSMEIPDTLYTVREDLMYYPSPQMRRQGFSAGFRLGTDIFLVWLICFL